MVDTKKNMLISLVGGIVALVGYGVPLSMAYFDKPVEVREVRDLNEDGFEDLVTFNRMKKQEVYLSEGEDAFRSSNGSVAKRESGMIVFDKYPYKSFKLELVGAGE